MPPNKIGDTSTLERVIYRELSLYDELLVKSNALVIIQPAPSVQFAIVHRTGMQNEIFHRTLKSFSMHLVFMATQHETYINTCFMSQWVVKRVE